MVVGWIFLPRNNIMSFIYFPASCRRASRTARYGRVLNDFVSCWNMESHGAFFPFLLLLLQDVSEDFRKGRGLKRVVSFGPSGRKETSKSRNS